MIVARFEVNARALDSLSRTEYDGSAWFIQAESGSGLAAADRWAPLVREGVRGAGAG